MKVLFLDKNEYKTIDARTITKSIDGLNLLCLTDRGIDIIPIEKLEMIMEEPPIELAI